MPVWSTKSHVVPLVLGTVGTLMVCLMEGRQIKTMVCSLGKLQIDHYIANLSSSVLCRVQCNSECLQIPCRPNLCHPIYHWSSLSEMCHKDCTVWHKDCCLWRQRWWPKCRNEARSKGSLLLGQNCHTVSGNSLHVIYL